MSSEIVESIVSISSSNAELKGQKRVNCFNGSRVPLNNSRNLSISVLSESCFNISSSSRAHSLMTSAFFVPDAANQVSRQHSTSSLYIATFLPLDSNLIDASLVK